MMRLGASVERLIGIDIASTSVKVVEVRRLKGGYRVESHAVQPLRQGAVAERCLRDADEVARALALAVRRAGSQTRRAAIAVPAGAAITKVLTLPASLGDEELEARIQADSDRHVPFPFHEVAFDFQRLGPSAHSPGQQDVLLVACRRQEVERLADVLTDAGLTPAVVEVETFALERAFARACSSLAAEDCVALVDVGATMSTFHALCGGRVLYRRDLPSGGSRFAEELGRRCGLDPQEAERAMRCGDPFGIDPAVVLRDLFDALAQQVGSALQLFYAAERERAIRHLVLIGGVSALPGLGERLGEACGLVVSRSDPSWGVTLAERVDADAWRAEAPAMLTALGLAMRAGS